MLSFVERHVVACLIGAIAAVFLVYEISVGFFAYTGDAFVETDVIFLAPEVSGPIAALPVIDDTVVRAGDTVAQIEPQPFEIAVASAEAEVALTTERIRLAEAAIAEATATVAAAQASLKDALTERARAEALVQSGGVSAAAWDQARRDARVAAADLRKAEALASVSETLVAVRRAERVAAGQALDKATYDLSRTRLVAPVSGRVAPLVAHTGDYATTGKTVAAIVSDENWYIKAALNERHLARVRPGQTVLFTIGSEPWRLHVGTLRAVAPGIARNDADPRALPYVPLDVDWIRVPRRFPVIIDMGPLPAERPLYRGADARVLIWF
ncbi:membrane fusion protein, multidrug efflux system [Enhydrobacter aerosaccus]|uniref:Membrane fusion protein, multidrug efflux system n=1 Tax=Enhydrobacter aerosaccus TaxID=225324 RepID=A0A1T4LML3_9HYPH|nr:membrane fusion protein, multidrug efflux system [Enhydrobacter aerosaccus]